MKISANHAFLHTACAAGEVGCCAKLETGDTYMAIFQTGSYRVKKSAVPKVKKSIQRFVRYVKTN